jgi:peptidoglycan hydrolase-like protein with peptidoglycan-binding domain
LDRLAASIFMTSREARFGLTAFALLLAALGVNLLGFQGVGPHKQRVAGGLSAAVDRPARIEAATQRVAAPVPSQSAEFVLKAGAQAEADTGDVARAIQRELQIRGYEAGSPDGVAGLMTRAAIMAFEFDHSMPLTGEATDATLKRILLGASPGEATAVKTNPGLEIGAAAQAVIRTVQQTLSSLNYNTGKVDGRLGEDTRRAIRDFETDNKMPETGRVSGSLIARLAKAAGHGQLPRSR